MKNFKRLHPIEAGKTFILERFPHCQGALLAGSIVRGEGTETSDLDIVIFDQILPTSYRESLIEFGWPIEIFVHNLTSYKEFFEMDCKSAKPSMPKMVSEGVVLKDEGVIQAIKMEANELLQKGPDKWGEEIIRTKRYFITDTLDDLLGSTNRAEELFTANTLAELVHEFVLRTNGRWIGASKWIVRALRQFDPAFTIEFVAAFDHFYRTGDKQKIVQLVEKILEPYGGRLFAGFSLGKS